MTDPEPSSQGSIWRRYGQGTFDFDVPETFLRLRLTGTKNEGGYVYVDLRGIRTDTDRRFITRPRVNMTSDATMEKLTKSLQIAAPLAGTAWREFLERICGVLVEQMGRHGVVTRMHRIDHDHLSQPMLFDDFMPMNLITALVTHGGGGKSLIAGMLALATVTGKEIGGFRSNVQGPVVYADWESGTDEDAWELHARRLTRICDGLGIDFPEDMLIHYAASASLAKCEAQLVELVMREGAVLTIADSMSYAAGGNLNDTDVASSATQVLKAVPRTKLMIAHVPKSSFDEENPNRKAGPLGSVLFWNGPQALYQLDKTDDDRGNVTWTFERQKGNVMAPQVRPIGLSAHFVDPAGPITLQRVAIKGDTEAGRNMRMDLRIFDYLVRHGRALEQNILYEFDALSDVRLKRRIQITLKGMMRHDRIVQFDNWWALAANEDTPHDVPDLGACSRCSEPATGYHESGRAVCDFHNPDME